MGIEIFKYYDVGRKVIRAANGESAVITHVDVTQGRVRVRWQHPVNAGRLKDQWLYTELFTPLCTNCGQPLGAHTGETSRCLFGPNTWE